MTKNKTEEDWIKQHIKVALDQLEMGLIEASKSTLKNLLRQPAEKMQDKCDCGKEKSQKVRMCDDCALLFEEELMGGLK